MSGCGFFYLFIFRSLAHLKSNLYRGAARHSWDLKTFYEAAALSCGCDAAAFAGCRELVSFDVLPRSPTRRLVRWTFACASHVSGSVRATLSDCCGPLRHFCEADKTIISLGPNPSKLLWDSDMRAFDLAENFSAHLQTIKLSDTQMRVSPIPRLSVNDRADDGSCLASVRAAHPSPASTNPPGLKAKCKVPLSYFWSFLPVWLSTRMCCSCFSQTFFHKQNTITVTCFCFFCFL